MYVATIGRWNDAFLDSLRCLFDQEEIQPSGRCIHRRSASTRGLASSPHACFSDTPLQIPLPFPLPFPFPQAPHHSSKRLILLRVKAKASKSPCVSPSSDLVFLLFLECPGPMAATGPLPLLLLSCIRLFPHGLLTDFSQYCLCHSQIPTLPPALLELVVY